MPVIGLLQIGAPSSWDFTGFRQGLKDTGYVEGQNLVVEIRWANDDPDRLPGLAADLAGAGPGRDQGGSHDVASASFPHASHPGRAAQ
jgi:hypothetical protein